MNFYMIRHDWNADSVLALLTAPWDELKAMAIKTHREFAATDVQQCELLSVKTGGCPEDCGYCSQSAHYKTPVKPEPLLSVETVAEKAKEAKARGATRFCLGAAWRDIPAENDPRFSRVLGMIRAVSTEGMEVCCTLGMATEGQLVKMKEAGLTAYNHNLDTSREFYPQIISTRTYDERLDTLKSARKAGVQLCCGGILGMGESERDVAAMLATLGGMTPHPESVPINLLVPVDGTPLAKAGDVDTTGLEAGQGVPFEKFLRTIAVARIVMPKSRVRLSAGRNTLTSEQQLQCFEAGANSIFVGEKLLTADNVDFPNDHQLLAMAAKRVAAPSPP